VERTLIAPGFGWVLRQAAIPKAHLAGNCPTRLQLLEGIDAECVVQARPHAAVGDNRNACGLRLVVHGQLSEYRVGVTAQIDHAGARLNSRPHTVGDKGERHGTQENINRREGFNQRRMIAHVKLHSRGDLLPDQVVDALGSLHSGVTVCIG
jgi:hypothetical protein